MADEIIQLLEANEKLTLENKALLQQLREATESIAAIKEGNIDALVIADKEAYKIFTEKTADKIYRILVETMHEGAVTLSKDGTILFCNSNFAHTIKQPLQKAIGSKFIDYIDSASKRRFETVFANQSWQGHQQVELKINPRTGDDVYVLMSVSTLTWENNSVISIIITDLTTQNKDREDLLQRTAQLLQRTEQLERSNVELLNANKDLLTFTYVSSHDLQEPLRKTMMFVSRLLEREGDKLLGDSRHSLQRISEIVTGMQTLILDLLKYSSTKSSERVLEKVDLTTIVDDLQKNFEEAIEEKRAIIEGVNLCIANIIPFQFRQLMNNLVSNSLKFSNPQIPPHILITTEIISGSKLQNEKLSPNLDYCHISYSDNGIGFDPIYKSRVFDVFQRLNRKEDYVGNGMGLAICKRIVENHNGIITASSELNKGARFDIYIPS